MGIRRVEVDGGGWLDVKEKLKIQDEANRQGYALSGVDVATSKFGYNMVNHRIATITNRILNWDLKDDQDKPIVYEAGKPFEKRVAVVAALDDDIFARVEDAVSAFEETLSKEKNAQMDGGIA